jgi:catechol 2,3-dioxygenase
MRYGACVSIINEVICMTTLSQQMTETQYTLPPTTRLGHVHLTVNDLDREITFYTRVLGLKLHARGDSEAALGTEGEILLRLTEDRAARRAQRTTGMYHFALLYPSHKELARAVARLFVLRYPNAPTDHGISKTTYLDDPEGNTIELYVRSLDDGRMELIDGQMAVRYADGRIGTGRDPLDLEALFSELTEQDRLDLPLPEGTQLGHIHLYVNSNEATLNFYSRVLGFQPGAYFPDFRFGDVGLDDQQNHVVAFNTWKGTGLPPTPDGALGMRYFTIVLPDSASLKQIVEHVHAAGIVTKGTPEGILIHDPAQNAVVLTDRMFSLD